MICLYIREFVKAKMLNMKLSNICGKERGKKKNEGVLQRVRVQKCYNEMEVNYTLSVLLNPSLSHKF